MILDQINIEKKARLQAEKIWSLAFFTTIAILFENRIFSNNIAIIHM